MATFTPATPLTAEAFWQHHNDKRRELVRGEIVEQMPPGGQHGPIQGDIYAALRTWAKRHGGYVTLESGFLISRDPDTLRGPDVSYVRPERIPPAGVPEGFWEQAPDLAVEVVSPGDTAEEIRGKVSEYLAAGSAEVWVAFPRTRQIVVHTPDGLAKTLNATDELSSPDLLPGFSLRLSELFV